MAQCLSNELCQVGISIYWRKFHGNIFDFDQYVTKKMRLFNQNDCISSIKSFIFFARIVFVNIQLGVLNSLYAQHMNGVIG